MTREPAETMELNQYQFRGSPESTQKIAVNEQPWANIGSADYERLCGNFSLKLFQNKKNRSKYLRQKFSARV